MNILIAPDKFKDSLDAKSAAIAIADGVSGAMPDTDIDLCPMSDGGEGFVESLVAAMNGRTIRRRVTGPLPEMKVDATFGIVGERLDTAVIEMSSAAGIALLPKEDRNPLYTTTFGVGELIRFAVEADCRRVLLGIGGSATCDAGIGCLQACGCHVILKSGEYARDSEPLCGRDLDDVLMVKSGRGSRVDGVEIVVACDVTNPLYGPAGSARVYGPQKGASPGDVELLDRMLESFAKRIGRDELAKQPGTGAAGGIGFGLAAMFDAKLTPGFKLVADAVSLRSRVANADLVFTGEGCFDETSLRGKVTGGVIELAREFGRPVVVLSGQRGNLKLGGVRSIALADRFPLDHCMAEPAKLLRTLAAEVTNKMSS